MVPGGRYTSGTSNKLHAIASCVYIYDFQLTGSSSRRRCELIAYFTAAWHSAIYGEPLFPDNIYAGPNGPSIESFPTRSSSIDNNTLNELSDDRTKRLLLAICKSMASIPTKDIGRSCMVADSPWAIARIGIPAESKAIIHPEVLKRSIWLTAGEEIRSLSC